MKVTIYTINDCKFSQAEKDYLKTNNIAFEEKNVEQNRDFLTEMLGISENFAGTPVTKIEKDDGTSNVLKGFTQEEFDKELGILTTPSITPAQDIMSPMPSMPPREVTMPDTASSNLTRSNAASAPEPAPMDISPISLSDMSTTPAVDTQTMPISLSDSPMPSTVPNMPISAPTVVSAPPVTGTPPADALNSVLENLQSQVNTPAVPASPAGRPAPVKPAIDPYAPTITNV